MVTDRRIATFANIANIEQAPAVHGSRYSAHSAFNTSLIDDVTPRRRSPRRLTSTFTGQLTVVDSPPSHPVQ
jgi:hypothetical protein